MKLLRGNMVFGITQFFLHRSFDFRVNNFLFPLIWEITLEMQGRFSICKIIDAVNHINVLEDKSDVILSKKAFEKINMPSR